MPKTEVILKILMIILKIVGIIIILAGLVFNPFLVEHFLSSDGQLAVSTVIKIIVVELIIVGAGVLLILFEKLNTEVKTLLVTIFICLVILEGSLQLYSALKCNPHYQLDPKIGVRFEPNKRHCFKIKDRKQKNFYYSNNEGFLDDNFNVNEDGKRIFLLGDSYAECVQVNSENCAHKLLEEKLTSSLGKKVNVYNFGISTYGAINELLILENFISKYKPELVIVYFVGQNDLIDNERNKAEIDDYKNQVRLNQLKRFMPKSLEFIQDGVKNILTKKGQAVPLENYQVYLESIPEDMKRRWEGQFSYLREMKKICDDLEIPFLVIITTTNEQLYPDYWQELLETYPELAGKDYNLTKPNEVMMRFRQTEEITCFDLLPKFKEKSEKLYFKLDGHWNEVGQKLAASLTHDFIINNELLNKNNSTGNRGDTEIIKEN
jgi:hypothetical protein